MCLVLNPGFHSEWDSIQESWLVTFSYFLVRCVGDFETRGCTKWKLPLEVKMVGVRACGDLVGNCETWKDQCLSGTTWGWMGECFFRGLPESGQHFPGKLSTIPLGWHPQIPHYTWPVFKFIQGPRFINWQSFRCFLIMITKKSYVQYKTYTCILFFSHSWCIPRIWILTPSRIDCQVPSIRPTWRRFTVRTDCYTLWLKRPHSHQKPRGRSLELYIIYISYFDQGHYHAIMCVSEETMSIFIHINTLFACFMIKFRHLRQDFCKATCGICDKAVPEA